MPDSIYLLSVETEPRGTPLRSKKLVQEPRVEIHSPRLGAFTVPFFLGSLLRAQALTHVNQSYG